MDVSIESGGVLQVEPTDHCNLSCRMCTPHFEGREQIHGIPKGFMPLGLFSRIVDGLVEDDLCFDHLILQWLGDPSLHPDLEEMVAIAMARLKERVGYLRIDTNAITLNPARMDRLVEAYSRAPQMPLLVVFTLDAVSPETYAHVKGRDALLQVERNIGHLLAARAALPFEDIRLNCQLQFVLQPGNSQEAGAFVQHWQQRLGEEGGGKGYNEIMIKRLSVGAGGPGQVEADKLYEQTCRHQGIQPFEDEVAKVLVWQERPWESTVESPSPRQPCPGMWMTPVIRHDGHLMMCCVDLPGALDLGSLYEHGFRELWEGEVANERRLAHVRGAFSGLSPCDSCGGINWYRTPPDFVETWLKEVGRSEAWPDYADRMGL